MSISAKPSSLQTYQILLYGKALHPEFFPLRNRRHLESGSYEVESWLMPGAHMVRFKHDKGCLTELVTDRNDNLPIDGALLTLPCAGERDFEHEFGQFGLKYVTAVQTETLRENLYTATYDEMVEFATETDSLIHEWRDEASGGACLSVLDVQRYGREVHAQSYHLTAAGGLVLRTQTIFEHR